MMYFLCTVGTPLTLISLLDRLKTSSIDSNLSAYSAQSPPICLQKVSVVMLGGISRFKPGGGNTGLTTLILILGVLNLKPDSVLPVKDRTETAA